MKKLIQSKTIRRGIYVFIFWLVAMFVILYFHSLERKFWFSMGWNLLLAVIPVVLAFFASRMRSGWRWLVGFFSFIFVPNAYYLMTDLRHLVWLHPKPESVYVIASDEWDALSGGSIWLSEMLLLGLGILGIICGVIALYLLIQMLAQRFRFSVKSVWAYAVALLMSLLSGYAIFLGRYPRLNSWEIVSQPFSSIRKLWQSSIELPEQAIFITILYGAFIFGSIASVLYIMREK